MEIVKTVEEEALYHHTGVIEKQAAQIYRLSVIVENLHQLLVGKNIIAEGDLEN